MSASIKILACGNVQNGDIKKFFNRITSINSKSGPFSLLLVVGDFFGSNEDDIQDLLTNTISVPLPTYIMEGSSSFPTQVLEAIESSGEVCTNVFALERAGVITTSEGLKIASVYGTATQTEISTMLENSPSSLGVDILLTYEWPEKVASESYKGDAVPGSREMAQIAVSHQPKYHFASNPSVFYEREPYSNQTANHSTRFLSLGAFGNSAKERWFYAMNLVPLAKSNTKSAPLPNTTPCPYPTGTKKRPAPEEDNGGSFFYGKRDGPKKQAKWEGWDGGSRGIPENYVCNACGEKATHYFKDCPMKLEKQQKVQEMQGRVNARPADQCWFCLSNPNLEKHLIVHIGEDAYVTMPKGPLIEHGGHLIILPIGHYPGTRAILDLTGDEKEEADRAIQEIDSIKVALRTIYAGKHEQLVFFEISGGESGRLQHMHFQAVAVPPSIASNLDKAFTKDCATAGLSLLEDNQLPGNTSTPYVRIELENKVLTYAPSEQVMQSWKAAQDAAARDGTRLKPGQRMDLQLPRAVLAYALGLERRINWKRCLVPENQEAEQAQRIKADLSEKITALMVKS
ncbi:hypothetical protein SmJEL517_g00944 [Synchytrium microbalum]|uniref:Cwf19-like C-terminal domain-containing protein n=1 Tax=Synchytrium microbalum TaxID=1806994 RepID=A0A507CGG8_9FUNG|nr:uncharacterized protein SmJEL517_g00944 [Synchytrium microbalum]TPX37126.1 hypothetical protein SmJEL517_g00944 [Synchytrium microbalum]